MNLSANAQATLLLTSDFSRAAASEYKPLSNSEWGKFALWLKHQRISPAELLVPQPQEKLTGWSDPRISQERILGLLARGHSLALAVDKWQRAGLWIITRGDADYPVRLKNRLRTDAPPVLFGCGNKALLAREMLRLTICAIPNNWPRNWPNRGFALSLVVREVLMNVQWRRHWRPGELPLAY